MQTGVPARPSMLAENDVIASICREGEAPAMALALRTVFIDQATDQVLAALAAAAGSSKAEVFRRGLSVGIKRVRDGLARPTLAVPAEPLLLKTIYLDAKTADRLRVEAFDEHVPVNDLVRAYLQAGL